MVSQFSLPDENTLALQEERVPLMRSRLEQPPATRMLAPSLTARSRPCATEDSVLASNSLGLTFVSLLDFGLSHVVMVVLRSSSSG